MIPKDLEVPPALGQTKIATSSTQPPESNKELSNCIELMRGRVQVQWELINDTVQIRVSAKIKEDQYVAFGLSASEGKPEFLGSDVVLISYNNRTNEFIAEDYYMSDFSQCDGQQGICPDNHIGGKNDVVLISGSRNNGITSVTFRRPLQTTELIRDKIIPKNKTSIIAAIGMLNADGKPNARHGFEKTTVDIQIDFTSHGVKQCTDSPHSISNDSETRAWSKSKIFGKDTFTARIGPTNIGSKRGIKFIPGSPLGIAWYIDDQLTPEIIVERGKNYTFLVEGGNDVNSSTRYHPFYITDNPEGGFEQKRRREQMEQKLYAGVAFGVDGFPYPTAAGRYCEWSYKNIDPGPLSNFKNFFETLKLDCEPGEPAKLLWLVAEETPDTVYYQCYRHNNLGWKIQVINDAALTFSPLLMITYVLLHNLLRFVT